MSHEYENTRRIQYDGGAVFVPVCETCGRYVKPNEVIHENFMGIHPEPNATCAKCGPTHMIFEGYL